MTRARVDSILRVARHAAIAAAVTGMLFGYPRGASAETLNDAFAAAYAYNPLLDAERARLRATDEDVARAISGYRPSVNATADAGHQHTNTRPDFGQNGSSSPRGYAVQLVQPVFRGFRTTNAVNSAEASVRAGRETLRATEQQVLLDTVTAYGDVVRDAAIIKLRQSNLSFLETELRATRDRFAVGEVTRTDVAQAEASRALGVSDLQSAIANHKSSLAAYEQVVGQAPRGLSDSNPNIRLLPKSLDEAVGIGTRENPQVVRALYTEQAARFDVEQIRGELLPEAQLEATYSDRFDSSSQIDETETTSIVGRVNVPIYPAGGEVYARVRQAKHTHLSRIQEIEQSRAAAQAQVTQAWAQLQGFRAQRESDRARIDANTTALNGVREEEKVGQRVLLDVLDAQQALLESQIRLAQTTRNVLVATYTVVSAIGRLSLAELGAASSAYDPEIHYEEVRRKWWGIDITHDDGRREHIDLQRGDRWGARVEHEPVK